MSEKTKVLSYGTFDGNGMEKAKQEGIPTWVGLYRIVFDIYIEAPLPSDQGCLQPSTSPIAGIQETQSGHE